MAKPSYDRAQTAHNEVTTNDQGVVVVVWRGRQTAETIRTTKQELTKQVGRLRAQHKKVLVLADVRAQKVADSTQQTRFATRELLTLPVDAWALVGQNALGAATTYLMRAVKPGTPARYFTNRRRAQDWLLGVTKVKTSRSSLSLVAAVIIAVIGVGALIGWQLSNDYLMRFLPSLRPINPIAACGLLVMGFGFLMYWLGRLKYLHWAGILGVALGIATLLPLGIDELLFRGQIISLDNAQLADSAAICFLLMGAAALLAGRPYSWVHPVQYVLSAVVAAIALFNIFGQLYAYDFIYGLSGNFVMAFNLALAFLVAGAALFLLVIYKEKGDVFGFVSRTGWLIVIALVGMQIATYATWSGAVNRNKAEAQERFEHQAEDIKQAITNRIKVYVDGLHGFKGLFAASDLVTQGDFNTYFTTLDLANRHPGLRTVSYVARVPEHELSAFVAARQQDSSLSPNGNPSFAIKSKVDTPTHYIVTYRGQDLASEFLGLDLGSIPGRTAVYDAALASGTGYASGTIQLLATDTQPAQNGFLLSMPVKTAHSSDYIGLIAASASYADFFPTVTAEQDLLSGITLRVTENSGTAIFESDDMQAAGLSKTVRLPVLNQQWQMQLQTSESFGLTATQLQLPRDVLAADQILSALLLILFIMQGRARRQALNLADSMTEDLQFERNRAVADDEKSRAILTSIGDAVFAIDNQGRITLFNLAAERISGYATAEAIGKPYKDILKFISRETGKTRELFISRALQGHLASMHNHTQLVRKDGQLVAVADSAAPIHGPRGEMLGAIIVFRDVSKEQALDQAKTEFVSLASHQLRTPLSAINWYVEALMHGDLGKLSKAQMDYLREVYEGNQRMIELVTSLLNVSRLDLGRLVNKPQPTDLAALIDDLEKELTSSIRQKHTQVTKHVQTKLPRVSADPKLLRMIVQNLMSNAVKYTPEKGNVEITLRHATPADLVAAKLRSRSGAHWLLAVKDSGYGIPHVQQDRIFEKLFRADNVRKLDVEGTGLGLYIVKQVVEKMGGRVWFTSIESVGTTFYVVLPFKTIPAKGIEGKPSLE